MEKEELKQRIDDAIEKLRQKDGVLLNIDVNERTISHKLAGYIQIELEGYSVDCEYNRYLYSTKILKIPKDPIRWKDLEAKPIFPDIIIHKRLSNDENLLVIEMKKLSNRQDRFFDKSKVKALTLPPFNYKFGLFLEIDVAKTNDSFEWYQNGSLM